MTWNGMGIRTDAVRCDHIGCAKWARREVAAGAPGNTMRAMRPQRMKVRGVRPGWEVDPDAEAPAHLCCGRHY